MLNDIAELRTFVHSAAAGRRTVGRLAESALLWVNTFRDVPEPTSAMSPVKAPGRGMTGVGPSEALAGDLWRMMVKAQK
jgi:hypothetical protein